MKAQKAGKWVGADPANFSPDELKQKFERVYSAVSNVFVGQHSAITALLMAFKRPFVIGYDKKRPVNTLFYLGLQSSGRHHLLKLTLQQLKKQNLFRSDEVVWLDLALYDGLSDIKLFYQDIFQALQAEAGVVAFDNIDKCPKNYLSAINKLVSKGRYRVILNGDEAFILLANQKYFVFVSTATENKIIELFAGQVMKYVSDIVQFVDYTEPEILAITRLLIQRLVDKCKDNLLFTLHYEEDFVIHCASKYQKNQGVVSLGNYLQFSIYKALSEYRLTNDITTAHTCYLRLQNNELNFFFDSLNSPVLMLETLLPKRYNEQHLEEIKQELESVVGLERVKQYILNLENNYQVQQRRINSGYKSTPLSILSMHVIFTGNPGTGKTMIARIFARYLKAIGLLSGGQLREVSRADLVGSYVGHTAKLTTEVIQSALGGVLFIDEAYALCRDKSDSFGQEAVDTLVKAMEDYRDDLVVILAGYRDEMQDFLQTNSGLKSRFPNMIEFEDYSAQEMLHIANITAQSKGYSIDLTCHQPLLMRFEQSQIKGRNDGGNGRLVRNLIEAAILEQSQRLASEYDAENENSIDMALLLTEDFQLNTHTPFDLEHALLPIIGLESIKQIIREQYTMLVANQKRLNAGINVDTKQSLNMIFTGNPGTGKTTIARVLAQMLKQMGLLKQGHLVEVDRSGLVAEYVGHTAGKTEKVFRSALGGVLFIDEAYSLSEKNGFDKEAIDTLVKLIEDYRGDIVIILAGYRKEMADFIKSNSGLESRFPMIVDFPDYSVEELFDIALSMISKKGFSLTDDAHVLLQEQIQQAKRTTTNESGNGRMVRNLIEKILRNQSARIAKTETNIDDLALILPIDIEQQKTVQLSQESLDERLNKIIGLDEVKRYIHSLYARLSILAERKKMGLPIEETQTLHMIFKGNPGTGKTMMARIVADVLYQIGIIKTNKLIETDRAGLVAGYVGQTAIKTRAKIQEAMGGVLFVDEAYSLSSSGAQDFGREAIDTLVKMMDDNRERLVVILAGYSANMDDFLQTNPGLRSRFANIIEFADYSIEQLLQISVQLYHDRGYELSDPAIVKMRDLFIQAIKQEAFGNGRYVRNVFEKSLNLQALRLSTHLERDRQELITIEAEDIPFI